MKWTVSYNNDTGPDDEGFWEWWEPQFNQNIAITGRLSGSAPNMQNTPLEIDELLVSRYN